MNADRPRGPMPPRLGADQGLPDEFLVGFTQPLVERREQLVRNGQPAELAKERTVAEAVQRFAARAGQRGWTVQERRIARLAADALGLEEEYHNRHGYPPELARLAAVGEVLQGEHAREEVPLPWRREADPPQRAVHDPRPRERTRPEGRPTVRTREAGRER